MTTLIVIAALSLIAIAIAWFILKKLGSPQSKARVLQAAYHACKESGASEDECLFTMLDTRPPWRSLPKPFLLEIATRLRTKENVTHFVIFSEGTGILQNLLRMPTTIDFDPGFALNNVVLALVSRANAFGNHGKFQEAKDVLQWALLLNPGFTNAWASMAVVAFGMRDFQAAAHWSEKVLNYVPNPNSDDALERGAAELMAPGGSERAAQLLGESGGTDSWTEIHKQMEAIRQACHQ